MELRRIKILFMVSADADNTNAQSLNAREIALRLDPTRFASTLFYERQPDRRVSDHPAIRLIKMPARGRTLRILGEMLAWPDVIAYADCSPASYLFLRMPKAMRRNKIAVNHVEAPSAQLDGLPQSFRRLRREVLTRCELHTAITDFIARELAESSGVKASCVLPVGVDTKMFMPPKARNNPLPVVLFAGTVMERKGPQLVVEAARKMPYAMFWIVGPGRNGFDATLRQRCRDQGISNVCFHGSRSQDEMVSLMQRSDIFLLPSHLEGLPKVTLEAAAAGLPCVVFRDYHTPSVVHGMTGYQMSSFDEMLSRLELLVQNRELRLRMGNAAVEHARKFDWDAVAPLWQQFYWQVATEHLASFEQVERAVA